LVSDCHFRFLVIRYQNRLLRHLQTIRGSLVSP
jgi:hypothetical protein